MSQFVSVLPPACLSEVITFTLASPVRPDGQLRQGRAGDVGLGGFDPAASLSMEHDFTDLTGFRSGLLDGESHTELIRLYKYPLCHPVMMTTAVAC